MRDPHVVSAVYRISTEGYNAFAAGASNAFVTPFGAFILKDGILKVAPKEHFSSASEIKTALRPILRAWEAQADLRDGIGAIRFKYESVELIDRDPPPPGGPVTINVELGELILSQRDSNRSLYPEQPPSSSRGL
jgi:hypothetical protein